MQTKDDTTNGAKTIEEHLLTRELVDFDVLTLHVLAKSDPQNIEATVGKASLTMNDEVLAKIADAWGSHREAITALISARIKPLLIQVALRDIPQEVTVTRQAILELVNVLRDFESLSQEYIKRNQNK